METQRHITTGEGGSLRRVPLPTRPEKVPWECVQPRGEKQPVNYGTLTPPRKKKEKKDASSGRRGQMNHHQPDLKNHIGAPKTRPTTTSAGRTNKEPKRKPKNPPRRNHKIKPLGGSNGRALKNRRSLDQKE